jgi:hypothetical protein
MLYQKRGAWGKFFGLDSNDEVTLDELEKVFY